MFVNIAKKLQVSLSLLYIQGIRCIVPFKKFRPLRGK